jgi:hypothetical protein
MLAAEAVAAILLQELLVQAAVVLVVQEIQHRRQLAELQTLVVVVAEMGGMKRL